MHHSTNAAVIAGAVADFKAWSDPYKNPDMAKVLDTASGASQANFHEQTKLYADQLNQTFQSIKANMKKVGSDQDENIKQLEAAMDDGIHAMQFEKLDAAATKLEKAMNQVDPARAEDHAVQANYLRELAREAFAASRPTQTHSSTSSTTP